MRGFRHRGHHHVARIESFSDAVFGFSLTLLVVSLQVPRTFADLRATVAAFPGFAFTFALLSYIWFLQYKFFRRYAMEDEWTIALNVMLLFVVVFFTYPLKFIFSFTNVTASQMRPGDIFPLWAIYDGGYAAVFTIFLLLHVHAFRRRKALELTALEVFDTKATMLTSTLQIAIAGLSLALVAALSASRAFGAALPVGGFTYYLVPLGATVLGFITGRRRRCLEQSPSDISTVL